MPGNARIGDLVSCVCCCHPVCVSTIGVFVTSSPNVFTNNRGQVRLTDVAMCDCGHPTIVVAGSPDTFVNNLPLARLGDPVVACPVGIIITNSPDTYTNDPAVLPETEPSEFIMPTPNTPMNSPNVQSGVTVFEYAATVGEDSTTPPTEEEIVIFKQAGISVENNQLLLIVPQETSEEPTPEPIVDSTAVDCELIPTPIPSSYRLSPSFVLADLTTNCAVSNYRVISQLGLSENTIVCNLQKFATNLLEPITEQFGRPVINSGFRHGSNTSWHNKGCAADLQWPGITDEVYYNRMVWIKDNLKWCELILEYGGNRPWLHVAYNEERNNRTNFKTRTNVPSTYVTGILKLKNVPGMGAV